MEKNINVRLTLKHDTEENWKKAIGFIPKLSEPIVYDEDDAHPYKRYKIGDGERNVNALPFDIGYNLKKLVLSRLNPINRISIDGIAYLHKVAEYSDNIQNRLLNKQVIGTVGYQQIAAQDEYQETKWAALCEQINENIAIATFNNLHMFIVKEQSLLTSSYYFTPSWSTPVEYTVELEAGVYFEYIQDDGAGALRYSIESVEENDEIALISDLIGKTGSATGAEIFNDYVNNQAIGKYAHAEGNSTWALGSDSHAQGMRTIAFGDYSSSEGAGQKVPITGWDDIEDLYTLTSEQIINKWNETFAEASDTNDGMVISAAVGDYSHVEGWGNLATAKATHVEGKNTQATETYAHAEGRSTKATAYAAHAEGRLTTASAQTAHAEGYSTTASGGEGSHAEGYGTEATNSSAHAEGRETHATGYRAHAEGLRTTASGNNAHSEGEDTVASGNNSHSEGKGAVASSEEAHAEGYLTTASGAKGSHAEGQSTLALGESSHAEGGFTEARGNYCHAEGKGTVAGKEAIYNSDGTTTWGTDFAHAEGEDTQALGYSSHAEGTVTLAKMQSAHSEGQYTIAGGYRSHAEGLRTVASGNNSHSENENTTASGQDSHAGGYYSTSSGACSFTHGRYLNATQDSQTVVGKFNADNANALFIVGNGGGTTNRKNAFEVISNAGKCSIKVGNSELTETTLAEADLKNLISKLTKYEKIFANIDSSQTHSYITCPAMQDTNLPEEIMPYAEITQMGALYDRGCDITSIDANGNQIDYYNPSDLHQYLLNTGIFYNVVAIHFDTGYVDYNDNETSTIKSLNIRDYIGYDNYIKVAPGGRIMSYGNECILRITQK